MKKKYSLLFIAFLCAFVSGFGQVIVKNSFEETAADTWTPLTFSTPPCATVDTWDYVTILDGVTPNEGNQFWGINDLNGTCGGSGFETITFPSYDISSYTGVTISFDYYIDGFDNGDDLGYEVWEDGVRTAFVNNWAGSTGGWTNLTHNVNATTTNVYLVLLVRQNGNGDYAGFDNVLLEGTALSGNFITVTQATGGNITPGTTNVADNANQSFTATAAACYTFTNWVVDGSPAGSTNPYDFINVTADHTITAVYTQDTFNITATTGANGSISPSGTTSVNCGADQTYTFTADSGYAIDDVLVDGISVGAVSSYDFTNVTGVHTISVSFVVYVGPCASESFNNSGNSSSYSTENWTGDNSVDWTATDSRSDQDLNGGEAIMLRNGSLTNDNPIPGGMGTITFDYAQIYSGTSTLKVIVDGIQYGGDIAVNSTSSSTFSFAVNIGGNISLELENSGNRTLINNLSWTCYSATPEPEIEIQGNSTEIVNGATTPNALDDTHFGNVAIAGGTAVHTFTIYNTGTADLTLTNASPYVTIGGANAGDFTLTANPSSPISDGGNTTFSIEFDPSGLGSRQATISIANDDGDENPYAFDIEGNGSNSSASDIIANSTFVYNSNIDYTAYQAATINNTAQSIDVFKFDIRDGGVTTDTDNLATQLTDITFNVVNNENIRSAALFNGNALISNTGIVAGNTISFTGLSYTAPDNGTASLSLRVTFLTTVTDNDQLEFTISSATADSSGSVFASANAGGAISSTINNRNRIEVIADRIAFTTQPTSTSVNTNLNTFNISAVDQFGNIDLDDSLSITLTTSGVGMTTSSPYTLTNGDLAISNVQFNTSQTGINLTATTTGLAFSNSSTSINFDILDVATGTYRTTSNGTWPSGTATWERLTGAGWTPATPAANTTELLIIRHTVTSRASFAAPAPRTYMIVENGASFDDGHNSTFGSLLVENGGEFIASNAAVDIAPTGTLTIKNGGTLVINSSTLNHGDGLFDGTENFEPNSTVEVRQFDNDTSPGEDDLVDSDSDITPNSEGYYFGNLYINFTFNLPSNDKAFTLVGLTGVQKLCSGDLIIENQTNSEQIQLVNRATNVEIGGNVIVTKNKFSFGTTNSSNITHTVKGNVIVNGTGAIIDLNTTSSGSASVLVNIEGDLIGTEGTLQSTDGECGFAFTGSTLQNIDVADAVPYKNINTYVRNTADVQLLNNNLKLNNSSTFTVEDGGTFNFNWAANGTTPLLISNGGSGSNKFDSDEGSILKITHLDGLVKNTANEGNVQLSVSNKSFNQTATFHYIGKDNQVTGDGLSTGSTGKLVYVNLIDNTKTLNLSNDIGIANAITLDPNGGKLEIQQGIVIGTNTGDFSGSGRLVMTDGEYRISTITNTQLTDYLPQLSNYSSYSLTGGIVHLNGVGSDNTQILSGVPNYVNLSFSGSNVLEGLPPLPPGLPTYKGISSAASVSNNITISEDAIVDIKNWSLGGSGTNLIMEDQGRFIMAGAGTKPDATGNYSFEPNTTIEFNSNGGFESVRLSNPVPDYANIVVSGDNVGTIANGSGPNSFIQFQSNGSFTVTGTGTFKQSNTFGFSGLANTSLSNANSPIITLLDNSTIEYQGANQNITPFSPEYKNVTISGTGIKTLGNPTDILVGEDLNMVASALTINSPEVLTVDDGVIVTGGDLTIEDSGSLIQINDTDTNSGPITMKRNANIRKLDYVYWSSPVDGFSINDVYGATTPTNRIYRWNPTIANPNGGQGNWVSAAGETMQRGVGYIVRGPESYTTTAANITSTFNNGKPFNGEFTVDVFRGSDEGEEDDDWNLIGNPYPSAINALSFLSNTVNTNVIDGFVNIWTHGNLPSNVTIDPFYDNFGSNYTANDYITHNGTGTTNGPSGFNGDIAAGQSFMVNMLNTSNDKVEFKNDMRNKAYVNSDFFRNEQVDEKHRIWLDLVSENASTTRILVGYVDHATQQRDRLYDAITDNQNFYSLIDNENFVIQGRGLPFDDADSIPLGLHVPSQNNHTIAIAAIDGLFETENQTIYLKDNAIGFIHNLSEAPYTFTSEAGEHNNRFEIVFQDTTLSIDENQLSNALTMIEQPDGTVKFNTSNALQIKNVKVYDVLGRLLYNLNGNSSTETYNLDKLSQAAYLAKVTLSNDVVITKKAIKRN